MAGLRLTEPAERDIADLLDWSEETFGLAARRRYEALVAAALSDLVQDWRRSGSVKRDDLCAGWRLYHIRHSRERARTPDGIVHSPRHVVAYRLEDGDTVIVLRVLHGSMDLDRHLDAARE
jgi:toxin ParE1/3/4